LSTSVEQTPVSRDLHSRWFGSNKRSLAFLLLVAFAVRLAFILIVPTTEAPDEHHHLWVVQFIRDHLCLPTAADVQGGAADAVYGSMPPIGYTFHILIARIFPLDQLVLAARFGSLLMGLVTVWLSYLAAREIFPDKSLLAAALPWAIVFHPQFAFLNSYSNNDSAAAACAAAIIYLLVITLRRGISKARSILIGALLGLIVLCKYNGLALIPTAGLTVIAAAWLHGTSLAAAIAAMAIMGVCSLVVAAWWFVRNYFVFDGDILGVNTGYKTFAANFAQPIDYKRPPLELLTSKRWWRFIFFSYWGLFGHMTRWMWRPTYFIYLGWLIGAIVGWLKTRSLISITVSDRKQLITPSIFAMLALASLVNLAAVLASQIGGPQGRYFFISELPLMALLLEGLWRLGPRAGKYAVLTFMAFNSIVCAGVWVWLSSLYGPPAHLLLR
jgi:4-amino-4-deoxy-L-arabinose transferase-like glycosyltransferase